MPYSFDSFDYLYYSPYMMDCYQNVIAAITDDNLWMYDIRNQQTNQHWI